MHTLTEGLAQRAIEPGYVSLTNGFNTRRGFKFSIFGSDGEEDDDSDEEDGEEDDEEDADSEGQDDKDEKVSRADLDAALRRMKAADKNAADLAKKVREYEDKDKDEKTKATERVEELESTLSSKDETIGQLRLQNAFLLSNSVTWDDPEYALDYAERKGYLKDVKDEDGNVDAKELKRALEKLSKDKPSMVSKTSEDEDEDDVPASGQRVGSKRKSTKKEADEADLRRRFPNAF